MQRLSRRVEMGHELMSEEIEVHPFIGTATFRATEQPTVELPRGRKIVNGNREMKRSHRNSMRNMRCRVTLACSRALVATEAAYASVIEMQSHGHTLSRPLLRPIRTRT